MNPWSGAGPELAIAGLTYAATAVAAYLVAGAGGLAVVTVIAVAAALVAMRSLLPQHKPETARTLRDKPAAQTISGYSRRRFVVRNASGASAFYESELRPVLEHILAARLAERHDTNLYADPETGRETLGDQLWYWIDPGLAGERRKRDRGIPPRTLARLINRLEDI
jgi:hypothetical protein